MGYADYKFYTENYYGALIGESSFCRYEDRAEAYIDEFTHRRLVSKLPGDRYTSKQIRKCVCEMAELLYRIDKYMEVTTIGDDGKTTMVKAMSAGTESITYAGEANPIAELAKKPGELRTNMFRTAVKYLDGLCDDNGICLLYGGV